MKLSHRALFSVKNSLPSKSIVRCFSLIEMMVAIAVLAILWILIAQVIGISFKTTQVSLQMVTEVQQARFVLDRLSYDWSMMPRRVDIGYHMTNSPEKDSDSIRFISRVKSWKGDRGLSLIGYQIREGSDQKNSLYRGIRGYDWEDRSFMGVNPSGKVLSLMDLTPELGLKPSDYELMSEGVFKIGVSFIRKSDGHVVRYQPDFTNWSALIVGLAVISPEVKKNVSPQELQKLSGKLVIEQDDLTPLQIWNPLIQSEIQSSPAPETLKLYKAVQVFERFYSLKE